MQTETAHSIGLFGLISVLVESRAIIGRSLENVETVLRLMSIKYQAEDEDNLKRQIIVDDCKLSPSCFEYSLNGQYHYRESRVRNMIIWIGRTSKWPSWLVLNKSGRFYTIFSSCPQRDLNRDKVILAEGVQERDQEVLIDLGQEFDWMIKTLIPWWQIDFALDYLVQKLRLVGENWEPGKYWRNFKEAKEEETDLSISLVLTHISQDQFRSSLRDSVDMCSDRQIDGLNNQQKAALDQLIELIA